MRVFNGFDFGTAVSPRVAQILRISISKSVPKLADFNGFDFRASVATGWCKFWRRLGQPFFEANFWSQQSHNQRSHKTMEKKHGILRNSICAASHLCGCVALSLTPAIIIQILASDSQCIYIYIKTWKCYGKCMSIQYIPSHVKHVVFSN